ncbi:MAG TPA: transglycosylase SLT domain-containing protein [Candidatus Binataceae bacterium]|nr:transglycosylase SLT domain-containing protein [Candidatus Binataceae bacterium]
MSFFCRRANPRFAVLAGTAAALVIVALCHAVAAQIFPFERNKVVDFDPRQSFADGYRAYQARDWPGTIERMQLVATRVPDLADYALFYLARAQRANGDPSAAAATMERLATDYPHSVFADQARLTYAQIEIDQGRPDLALPAAAAAANGTTDTGLEQNARLLWARALLATGDYRGAYAQAQDLRAGFPYGANDAAARALVYAMLAAHPDVADHTSLDYCRGEAALLLREGQFALAQDQIDAALALAPPPTIHAELLWMEAAATRADPAAQRTALARYLTFAPAGSEAAAALNDLAHSWWHAGDTARARDYFTRVVREFPGSARAPMAMFEIGRTYEDDGDLDAARAQFQRLAARYPDSEIAADARFRAAFMLYLLKRYDLAGAEFAAAEPRAASPSERDMLRYWQARALERNGQSTAARVIYLRLAASIDSNYYPALAALRVGAPPIDFPAAAASDPVATAIPSAAGVAEFHLARVLALRALGLRDLEAPELRRLADDSAGNPALRDFVLAEYAAAGAWYDGIVAATRLSARGELNTDVAERMRYPRGYWDLVSGAAAANHLDPYLVLALIHQESLFNPAARSSSNAQGLMQLLPATAAKWAPKAGVDSSSLDLYDPPLNLRVGTVYLRQLFAMFGGDSFKAVAAYNGGEHAVAGWNAKFSGDDDAWVENIGYRETRDYVKKVIGGLREYRLIYQAGSLAIPATAASAPPANMLPPPLLNTPRPSGPMRLPPAPLPR